MVWWIGLYYGDRADSSRSTFVNYQIGATREEVEAIAGEINASNNGHLALPFEQPRIFTIERFRADVPEAFAVPEPWTPEELDALSSSMAAL
jgi:hypothetical protein